VSVKSILNPIFIISLMVVLLVACNNQTETTETAVSSTPIPPTTPPTTLPTLLPTPTPEATRTLTAAEFRDAQATAVLTTLPGYDPAHHDALLPLARALWGDEYRIDPAQVTILPGETAVQVIAGAGGRYPSGTIFVVNPEAADNPDQLGPEHVLTLTPSTDDEGNLRTISRTQLAINGSQVTTWVEWSADGRLHRLVDKATNQWATPLDFNPVTGEYTIYQLEEINGNGQTNGDGSIWWTNGGESRQIAHGPNGQPMTEYLAANPTHSLSERDGQLVMTDGDTVLFALIDAATGQWQEAASPAEAFYTRAYELYGGYGITLDSNVETGPGGRMTIYSVVNGQRVEAVRTAINPDGTVYLDEHGHPVPLFATEAYALADSKPLQGGNLGDRIFIYYQNGVPVLDKGRIINLDEARVRAQVEALLNVPTGLPVQNVLSADQLTKNHQLTSEEGTVRIERVNVILGRIRNQLPGYRAMYTNSSPTGPGSTSNESYGYLWNPDNPDEITIMIYYDDSFFTNRNTDFQYRNSLLIGNMLKGIALLQSRSRPVFIFPKTSIDVFTDLNEIGKDFRWLAVNNPAVGWYLALDYHVSDD